jgi:hypothetical protein
MRLIHQINDMNHDVKLVSQVIRCLPLLVNLVALWHATLASHDHKLLLFTKSYKNQLNLLLPNFGSLKIHFKNLIFCKNHQVVISTIVIEP